MRHTLRRSRGDSSPIDLPFLEAVYELTSPVPRMIANLLLIGHAPIDCHIHADQAIFAVDGDHGSIAVHFNGWLVCSACPGNNRVGYQVAIRVEQAQANQHWQADLILRQDVSQRRYIDPGQHDRNSSCLYVRAFLDSGYLDKRTEPEPIVAARGDGAGPGP